MKVEILPVSWKRPPFQYVTLNTDASVVHGREAGGGLLQDHEGKVIFAFYKEFRETDVIIAESLALLHGLRLCSVAFKGRLMVEADSLMLVNLVNTRNSAKWPLCNFVRQIRELVRSYSASVCHSFKEANHAANELAGSNLGREWVATSFASLLGKVRAIVLLDSREFSNVWVQCVRE
nr:uncharacterized protein LOC113723910 [Coffea arabica]